jgi:hypothetical protein
MSKSPARAGAHDHNKGGYTHANNPFESKWQKRPCAQCKSRNRRERSSSAVKVCTIAAMTPMEIPSWIDDISEEGPPILKM